MEIKAKKQFGQNFLIDKTILNKIIQAMPDTKSLTLVEIGPGLGDLTIELLKIDKLKAYEVDRDLFKHLKFVFKEEIEKNRLELIEGDVLEFWQKDKSLCEKSYLLVANLPYYITTPIIENVLEDANCLGAIVMIQKEVAQKISANCGSSNYTSLSVLTQAFGSVEIVSDVFPESFNPPPKVISSVVKLTKKHFEDKNISAFAFLKYLKKAFLAPRKTLFKNLSNSYEKAFVLQLFIDFGIEQNLRPHQISVDIHFRLFNKLKN
ncbi:MAG: 16S rRNA (adenine(1518)-N(6)/adenine(1519)-N(6))-dimethyltransferase RsmA [Campylobacteraceae bacterium]